MPKITSVSARRLVRVFEQDGWTVRPKKGKGGHIAMVKDGCLRPIIIPDHPRGVSKDVILSNLRTAGMSRARYFELLANT